MKFKKLFSLAILFLMSIPFNLKVTAINAAKTTQIKTEKQIEINKLPAKSYILMDANSGEILYEKNADEKLPVASLTKIMTMLLVVEAIDEKKISLKDLVTATKNAKPSLYESSLWLKVGEKMSVKDLLKAVVINSANDATRTLAEHVAKSQKNFVNLMNEKAKKLNLKNTHFVNVTGKDSKKHYSSARDFAIVAKELLKHKWILNFTSTITETLRNGKFTLGNTNEMLQSYKGCNGLKTGYTENAGYCSVSTATRKNKTLCAVSLGSKEKNERIKTCTNLLDYGFKKLKNKN